MRRLSLSGLTSHELHFFVCLSVFRSAPCLCEKHRISGFGQRVRPAEALRRQGTANWPVVPSLTPPPLFTIFFLHTYLLTYFIFPLVRFRVFQPFGRRMRMFGRTPLGAIGACTAWSATRALQPCRPHRRHRSPSPACMLLRQYLRLLRSACSRHSLLCRRLSPPVARTRRTRDEGSLLRRLTALPPRQQDRAGEPADRSRDMLKLVRPCRPSLASTCREGGKRKEHPPSPGSPVRSRPAPPGQGTANGRGFAVRGTSGRSNNPALFLT